jgi:protein-disulfide isomerase/uncharacterized membrane protein
MSEFSAPVPPVSEPAAPAGKSVRSAVLFIIELLLLAVCVAVAAALVVEHFGLMRLPGFGRGSGCAAVVASKVGTIRGLWPVSFLGLAYFTGLIVAWLVRGNGVAPALRALVRFGALVSLGLMVVMVWKRQYCAYCFAIHAANLAFWLLMECTARRGGSWLRPLVAVCLVFALVSAGLFVNEPRGKKAKRAQRAAAKRAADPAADDDDAAASDDSEKSGALEPRPRKGKRGKRPGSNRPAAKQAESSRPLSNEAIGERYRRGPDAAKVRLVLFIDYQCPVCSKLDKEVQAALDQHPADVSVVVRQYPLCPECNRVYKENTHPNACRAARAAETAGILGGTDGFWRMNTWLYERQGEFTDDELRESLAALRFEDVDKFARTMGLAPAPPSGNPEVLRRIFADIDEAAARRLQRTPGVFINGVEIKAAEEGKESLVQAVTAELNKQRQAATPASDKRPAAPSGPPKP